MRILHVTDTFLPTLGGVEILVHDLSTRQAREGHEVSILTRTRGSTEADVPGVRVMRGRALDPALLARVDVVHAHVSTLSVLAVRTAEAAAVAGVPVVATVHSMWSGAGGLFRAAALVRDWGALPIQWAAVSEAAAAPLRRALGPSQPVIILPNAIDTNAWTPRAPEVRRQEVTLVSVMRLVRRKRPFALLRMLRDVRALVPEDIAVRAVIVGDGTWRRVMQSRIDATGMRDWVELSGSLERSEIRELYRSADIYVAPANLESFGIAVLEARAAGLAVVAKRATGVAELIVEGLEGHLTDTDRGMVQQIARLSTDGPARQAILDHNRAIEPGYDWCSVLPRIEAAYATALGRTGRRLPNRSRAAALEAQPVAALARHRGIRGR